MKDLSTATAAELLKTVREPRYMVEIDFPSGKVKLVTGDPDNIATNEIGTVSHVLMDVTRLTDKRANIVFQLGDPTFISDFFSTSLGQKSVRVWTYYDFESGTVGWCDLIPEFTGVVNRVAGDMEKATLQAVLPAYQFPTTRINPTGGFHWITPPQVITLNNLTITVSRRGLR